MVVRCSHGDTEVDCCTISVVASVSDTVPMANARYISTIDLTQGGGGGGGGVLASTFSEGRLLQDGLL